MTCKNTQQTRNYEELVLIDKHSKRQTKMLVVRTK